MTLDLKTDSNISGEARAGVSESGPPVCSWLAPTSPLEVVSPSATLTILKCKSTRKIVYFLYLLAKFVRS